MRFVFVVLMCLMVLFAAVQYNDSDGLMWIFFYAIPAFWCALATFRLKLLGHTWIVMALLASIMAALGGVVWFWPLTPHFWTKEVWYNVETAREGMGLMIVACVLLVVLFQARRQHKMRAASQKIQQPATSNR